MTTIDYAYVYVYIYVLEWRVLSALRFCFEKRFALYKSYPLLLSLLLIITMTSLTKQSFPISLSDIMGHLLTLQLLKSCSKGAVEVGEGSERFRLAESLSETSSMM